MQSPRKSPRHATKASLLTPAQFKETLQRHILVAKELDSLKREAKKDKSGKVTKMGRELGTKQIGKLQTLNYKQMAKLSTQYLRTYRRVKADRVSTANGGFRQPLLVGDILRGFFRTADLGRVGGKNDASGQPLQSVLSFLGEQPIASRSILTSLFALYAKRHSLSSRAAFNQGKPAELMNHQLLSVDETMNQQLNTLLTALEQESANKLAAKGVQDGSPKPLVMPKSGKERKYYRDDAKTQPVWNDFEHAFNRQNFSYSYLQGIFNKNVSPAVDAAGSKEPFLVRPPELAKAYMTEVNRLETEGALGSVGNTFNDVANRVSGGAPSPGLQLRVALDTIHSIIAAASATYNVVRPKAKATRKPKKVTA